MAIWVIGHFLGILFLLGLAGASSSSSSESKLISSSCKYIKNREKKRNSRLVSQMPRVGYTNAKKKTTPDQKQKKPCFDFLTFYLRLRLRLHGHTYVGTLCKWHVYATRCPSYHPCLSGYFWRQPIHAIFCLLLLLF